MPKRQSGRRKLTAIDLFAGCGGLTLGLKQAGFKVLGAVEVNDLAAETFRRNHRSTKLWQEDIRALPAIRAARELNLARGELDLLAGCPPCQGFSSVRTLNGKRRATGLNSSLVMEFLRWVRVLRPKAVLVENVPGLARNWRLREFKRSLRKLGYRLSVEVRDAQEFGVPQRRRRMILLAHLDEQPSRVKGLEGSQTVRDAIGSLPNPGKSGDPCHDAPESRQRHVMDLIRSIPRDGGSRSSLGHAKQLACHKKTDGFKDVYGRMKWDSVAPTITGGCVSPSKGRFLHPTQNRAITLREAALLQGFPRRYFISLQQGKGAAAQMIGNAFPPAFARAQATHVSAIIRKWSARD